MTLSGAFSTPSFTDVAVLNGTFYASDVTGSPGGFNLVSFDPVTGVTTFLNGQGGDINWHGLAANPNAGVLYAVDKTDGNFHLILQIPTTSTLTLLGNVRSGIAIDDLTYDAKNSVLYGIAQGGSLYAIDTTNGTPTLLGNTGLTPPGAPFELYGLALNSATGTFYVTATAAAGGNTYEQGSIRSARSGTIGTPADIGSLGAQRGCRRPGVRPHRRARARDRDAPRRRVGGPGRRQGAAASPGGRRGRAGPLKRRLTTRHFSRDVGCLRVAHGLRSHRRATRR